MMTPCRTGSRTRPARTPPTAPPRSVSGIIMASTREAETRRCSSEGLRLGGGCEQTRRVFFFLGGVGGEGRSKNQVGGLGGGGRTRSRDKYCCRLRLVNIGYATHSTIGGGNSFMVHGRLPVSPIEPSKRNTCVTLETNSTAACLLHASGREILRPLSPSTPSIAISGESDDQFLPPRSIPARISRSCTSKTIRCRQSAPASIRVRYV